MIKIKVVLETYPFGVHSLRVIDRSRDSPPLFLRRETLRQYIPAGRHEQQFVSISDACQRLRFPCLVGGPRNEAVLEVHRVDERKCALGWAFAKEFAGPEVHNAPGGYFKSNVRQGGGEGLHQP